MEWLVFILDLFHYSSINNIQIEVDDSRQSIESRGATGELPM